MTTIYVPIAKNANIDYLTIPQQTVSALNRHFWVQQEGHSGEVQFSVFLFTHVVPQVSMLWCYKNTV